jgi:hypothetical protein
MFSKPFFLGATPCYENTKIKKAWPYSPKLSGAELSYSATGKEMLGVIALREWRCYLEGKPFALVTHHQPNTYLDTTSIGHTMRRRARRLDGSGGFDYVWRYRKGRINMADPISRAPQHLWGTRMRSPMHFARVVNKRCTNPLPNIYILFWCEIKISFPAVHTVVVLSSLPTK